MLGPHLYLSILAYLAQTWALDNGLGLSGPAMGWSSWNHFGNNGSHCHCRLGADGLMQALTCLSLPVWNYFFLFHLRILKYHGVKKMHIMFRMNLPCRWRMPWLNLVYATPAGVMSTWMVGGHRTETNRRDIWYQIHISFQMGSSPLRTTSIRAGSFSVIFSYKQTEMVACELISFYNISND